MRNYTSEKYKNLVEDTSDTILRTYMETEMNLISQIENPKNKTLVDLGAGYGRVVSDLANFAKEVIAIEINPEMLGTLNKKAGEYKNVSVIEGDIQDLSEILEGKEIENPVMLLLQNTLGTIEGDYKKVLSEMKISAERYNGEIVISLFRQEALEDWGIKLYTKISDLTGEPDLEKTNFQKGLFVSKTGYASKWWTASEIKEIRDYFNGRLINKASSHYFFIMHLHL